MPKKIMTQEEIETARLKKNARLREWRAKNKDYVQKYMSNWYARKEDEKIEKITFKKFNEAK